MLKLSTTTRLKPADVVKQAEDYFGKRYGLKLLRKNETCASFEGGGGIVDIVTGTGAKGTTVDVESREWDSQITDFIAKLKK